MIKNPAPYALRKDILNIANSISVKINVKVLFKNETLVFKPKLSILRNSLSHILMNRGITRFIQGVNP